MTDMKAIPSSKVAVCEMDRPNQDIDNFTNAIEAAATKYRMRTVCFATQKGPKENEEEGVLFIEGATTRTLLAFGHTVLSYPLLRRGLEMAMMAIKDAGEGKNEGKNND